MVSRISPRNFWKVLQQATWPYSRGISCNRSGTWQGVVWDYMLNYTRCTLTISLVTNLSVEASDSRDSSKRLESFWSNMWVWVMGQTSTYLTTTEISVWTGFGLLESKMERDQRGSMQRTRIVDTIELVNNWGGGWVLSLRFGRDDPGRFR